MSEIKKKSKNKKNKKTSLFKKYFLSMAAVVGGALLFMGFFITIVISVQWWNDRVEDMKINAKDLAANITSEAFSPYGEKERAALSSELATINSATNSDYFIIDTEGRVLICQDSKEAFATDSECEMHSKTIIDEEHVTRALKDGFSEYMTYSEMGYGLFLLAVPIKENESTIGAVYVVKDAVSGLVPYILSILETVFVVTIVALVICFIVIFSLSKSIIGPIEEMSEATKHFAKGDFQYRVKGDYKEEHLNQFAKSLNKMADDLAIENEAQKSFVANVSHELKTPMTSIGGFVDGIRDGTIPREKEMEYLDIVSNEVKRLTRMVYAMLNLSKIESGEVSLSPVTYNIVPQIFETLLTFEKVIDEKHVNIVGFEDLSQVNISGDKDLLQQVVYNLIDNAVKFVDDGGTITIFAERAHHATTVRIRNTGKTIPNEEISRIFERFYKVDKSRSFDRKGVGLGLYIVKTIINMHDGDISASSVEGQYTQFEFTIPDQNDEN